MEGIKIKNMYFADAYLQMFDLLDDCIIIINEKEEIIFMNKASENLDKIDRETAIGKKYREIYKVNVHSSSTLRCLNSHEIVSSMYQDYITNRGDNIVTISSSYPFVENGKMKGVFTVTKDITRYEEMMRIFRRNYNRVGKDKFSKPEASYHFEDIVGNDKDLIETIDMAKRAAKTDANILIYGETGTGKELFAQSIYNESGLRGDFVSINCAAIPENLLESMLFGTVKGAYTGSVDKAGLFEEADEGCLFLDELNSMSPDLQAKILRAVETGRIRRVGENKERNINVKIISTTNVHPLEAVEDGDIRRDLYYRLGVVTITIPPLRERKSDVLVLANFFIEKFNKRYNKKIKEISEDVKKALMNFNWKGNVRELEHNIEHSMIMVEADREVLEFNDLPGFIKDYYKENNLDEKENSETVQVDNLDLHLEKLEKNLIEKELKSTDKNISQAAKNLGLSRQTLDYRIKKYGIEL